MRAPISLLFILLAWLISNKPLKSGPPLNERKLTAEVIARNVNGRFKNATEEERRGVTLYIQSFLKK